MAASVVAVLVLGGLVFLLYRGLSKSSAAAVSLDNARGRLENYYERDPFPSHTNVLVEKSNVERMKEWREDLLKRLSEGCLEVPGKTPAQFQSFLTSETRALVDAARRNGVKVPAGFSFGFTRYADGKLLPEARDDLPTRLAEQLVHVEHVCRILFDAHISELTMVSRDEYPIEKGDAYGSTVYSPGPSGPKPIGPQPLRLARQTGAAGVPAAAKQSSAEYRKLHFTFEFRATEKVIVDVLNRLARDPVFIVVNSVDLDTIPDLQLGVSPSRKEDVTNVVGRAVSRVVCGPDMVEPMQAKVELDVYRF